MHPILFKLGSLTFYTYGLLMALAFITAYFYLLHLAKITNQDVEFYSNFFFWIMVMGILGAKALYLIVDIKNLANNVKDVVGCIRGGLVWYGGVIAVLAFAYFYAKKYRTNYARLADTIASPAMVGLGIGRWGCLMAGCCYGKPTNLPWAIVYPDHPLHHPMAGIPVHPAPVYESIADFIIALISYAVFRKSKKRGITVLLVIMLYAIVRFSIEFLRGDVERGFVLSDKISTSQFISILLFIPALALFIRQMLKPKEPDEPKPEEKKGKKEKRKK
jgi:phosphatidylglycerol:prolipoprotein diacylglycerol transferase